MKRSPRNPPNARDDLDERLQRGFRYAMALTHQAFQAEDLVQDACLRLLNRNKAIELPVLLITIRNRYIDLYRHAKRFPTNSLSSDSNVIQLNPASITTREEDRFVDSDILSKSLGRLSMEEREAIYFWAVEGYTANEIAKIVSLSRNTVLSRIHRARVKLRDMLHKVNAEVVP